MKVLIIAFVCSLLSLNAFAQSSWKELTSARLVIETSGVPKNDPFEVGFLIQLKKGWHTYWKNSGDSGAGPRFEWLEGGDGITGPRFPTPIRIEEAGIVTFGYEDQVLFVFKHPGMSETSRLKVKAEWLVCKDVCLPAEDTFELTVPVQPLKDIKSSESRPVFDRTRQRWPLPVEMSVDVRGTEAHYSIPLKTKPKSFSFFPFESLPYAKLKSSSHSYENNAFHWVMDLKSPASPKGLGGIVSLDMGTHFENYEPDATELWPADQQSPSTQSSPGSLLIFLFAFIGGLILNLMPCVFPILSMKLFGVLKVSGVDPGEVRRENFSYVSGVIVTFLGLGVVLSIIRQAGAQIGWGFQLQSPLFVGALILLFVVLALEMFGYFTFDLLDPSKGQSLTRKKGFWGSFFTGVLAVVVASPCSAPFMGVAVGAALARPGLGGVLVFFFLGLGLSFPYLILGLAPSLLRWVPKPGRWMNVVKEFMAFPLLLTAVWLLWLFTQVADAPSVLVLGATLVAVIFSFWVSSFSRKLAWLLALLSLVGFILFHVNHPIEKTAAVSDPRWTPYSEEVITNRQGETVFVNMTAQWCLTCKVNEKLVFEDEAVKEAFDKYKVVQVKGDWTKRDPHITAFLNRFHRAGVPFYVIFSDKYPNGDVLSEVLTPEGLIEKLKENAK